MKAHQARPILRERTAYSVGRTLANVLLIFSLLGNVALVLLAVVAPQWSPVAGDPAVFILSVVAIFNALLSILLWELAHAMFDRSDAALCQLTVEGILGV